MNYRLSEFLWVWSVGAKGTFITLRWAGLFGNPGNSISTISFDKTHINGDYITVSKNRYILVRR